MTAAPAASVTRTSTDRPIVRATAGLALLGSGLVHFAVAPQQTPVLLGVLVILATAELAFAVGVLSARVPLGAGTAVAACIPLVVWALLTLGAAVLSADTALPAGPMLAGGALGIIAALTLAASVRFTPHATTAARPWTFTVALVVGAALLPFIAVPAMSAAQYPAGDPPSMSQLHGHHH